MDEKVAFTKTHCLKAEGKKKMCQLTPWDEIINPKNYKIGMVEVQTSTPVFLLLVQEKRSTDLMR